MFKSDFPLSPRKTAKQERSRRKAEHILDTTLALLAEGQGDRVTTKMIAQRAEISIGNLYQFYPNKEALFYDLFQRWMERVIAALNRLEDTLHAADPAERVPLFLAGILNDIGCDAELNGAGHWALRSVMERSPELSQVSLQHNERFLSSLDALRYLCVAEGTSDPAPEIKLLQSQITAACLYVMSTTQDKSRRDNVREQSKKLMLQSLFLNE